MSSVRWLCVACIATALTGCYKATFVDSRTAAGVTRDESNDFFLFGLVGEERADVRGYCEGQVASVRTAGNFGTGLVSLVTIGIYTPRKLYVTCADPDATRALASHAVKEQTR